MQKGDWGYCKTCGSPAKVQGALHTGNYYGRCSKCDILVITLPERRTRPKPAPQLKVLKTTWSSNMAGVLGIIVAENEMGKRSIYAAPVSGYDLAKDVDYIRDWGGKVDPQALREILQLYEESPKGNP